LTDPPSPLGDDTPALFLQEGDHLVPTVSTVGPWRPDALHGAAVAALFAGVFERPDRTVARITVDLLHSVPLKPLRLAVTDVSTGRRVQRRSAVLSDGERAVAQATAVYVAQTEVDLPETTTSRPAPQSAGDVTPPPRDLALLPESRTGWAGFENRALAIHTESEDRSELRGWFRLLVPAIAGHPVSGLQIALAAADYTSGGTALVLSLQRWSFASLDLTVTLTRPPEGDWIGLVAPRALLGKAGIGISTSVLHDARGVFGRCIQTQFVQALS
jgi:Thioesterase-like superfamily